MELIIKIPDEQYNDIVKHLTDNDGNYAYSDFNLREIIRNGKPYNPSGDLISREALKEQKVYSREIHKYVVPVCDIDKAEAVEQDWRFYYNHGYKQAERDLKRPKGEWKLVVRDNKDIDVICPFCNRTRFPAYSHGYTIEELEEYLIRQHLPKFCEHCGADMRKESNNG